MSRHIYSTVQGPPQPRPRSYGTRSERIEAWLWHHPVLQFVAVVVVHVVLVTAFLWCAFAVKP